MTKRREPLTYDRTLTMIAARIGWDRCAALCGVTERRVRAWSDPECETEIRLIDAERLDRAFLDAGGDHPPFHHLFALRLDIAGRGLGGDVALAAAAVAKETGEAVSAMVIHAQHPTPTSLRAARKEMEEAAVAITEGIAALDAQDRAQGPQQ
ncbi:MAG TPA: hypothetical protein VN222_09755 [Novosphingobium sp.]|nr:hypothetical protein [Novosphingobium sp.]